jgi:hypothetical protein
VAVVLFVVLILVVGVASFLYAPSASSVVVTGINFSSPDDACGLDGATDSGFNDTTSDAIQFTYGLSGNSSADGGTAACTIENITTTTPGFSVTGANTPLFIPANSTQDFTFTLNTPSSPYTGVLTLVIT